MEENKDRYSDLRQELIKLKINIQFFEEHYAKLHAKEGSYVTYSDGVIHGQWFQCMTFNKSLCDILSKFGE